MGTISGLMAYSDRHEAIEIDNQRLGYRLDFVLRGYREFSFLLEQRTKCSVPWRKLLGWAFRYFAFEMG